MNGKHRSNPKKRLPTYHTCFRHHDLTILLANSKKQICNTCFATLKKSYFNVIAGCLLELHYLHKLTRNLAEQNARASNIFEQHQDIISKLAAEITDIKNNGRNHEPPTQQSTNHTIQSPAPKADLPPSKGASKIRTAGHVYQAALALQQLLRLKIARILKAGKKATSRNTPKRDDLKDGKGTTHTHGGFLMTSPSDGSQDKGSLPLHNEEVHWK